MQTAREQADQRIKAVEDAFTNAIGEWTGVGVSLGSIFGISPKDQVLGSIKSMQTLGFEPWRARVEKISPNDQASWDRWIKDGQDMLVNLQGIAQDATAASLPGIIAETASATVVETAQKTGAVVTAVWNAKGMIIAGVVALAVIVVVWKFKGAA
jgi:hypothetical protein